MKTRRSRLVGVGLALLLILALTSIPLLGQGGLLARVAPVAGDNTIQLTNGQYAALQGAEMMLLLEQPPRLVYLPLLVR